MNGIQTSIWEPYARQSPVWQHEKLRSHNLPGGSASSKYAVDLAATMTTHMTYDLLGIKLKSSASKNSWNRLAPVFSFALALRELAEIAQKDSVVSPTDARYLMLQLDALIPGLGGLILRDVSTHPGQLSDFLPKANRIIETLVEAVDGSFGRKAPDHIMRVLAITAEVQGGLAGVMAIWPYISSADTSEVFKPLLVGDLV